MDTGSQGTRTSLYSIRCIVIRLGAVMLALSVVGGSFGFFGPGQSGDFSVGERVSVLMFLVACLGAAFLLWLYPGALARLASARSSHQIFESSLDARQIQWVAFSVLGMYWIMTGLLDLAHTGYQFIWLSEALGTGEESARRLHGQIAYCAFEIILGIFLTLGARGLAHFLQKIRYAGSSGMSLRKPPGSEDPD
jgi:hypothetical protein